MFLSADPYARLDLYHQRSAELIRQADEYRAARAARPRRSPVFRIFVRSSRICAPV
jgi:hypothetical protein